MNDGSYGLRFDIYERVHLSDEVVGIDQLEEVELTPHIQVIPAGDQVTVRGSLLLVGAYVCASDAQSSHSLEHWIPVEITLPLNRVRSLDDISVDIEHFDVDLLSIRTLNITGILSLRGISMESIEPVAWEPEQFTVVHQTRPEPEVEEPSWLSDYSVYTAGNKNHERYTYQAESTAHSNKDSTEDDGEDEAVSTSTYQELDSETYRRDSEEDQANDVVSEPIIPREEDVLLDSSTSEPERVPLIWKNPHWSKQVQEKARAEPFMQQGVEEKFEEERLVNDAEVASSEGNKVRIIDSSCTESSNSVDAVELPEFTSRVDEREKKSVIQVAEADSTMSLAATSNSHEDRDEVWVAAQVKEEEDVAVGKQEMKIAIGKAKPSEAAAESVGFSSLLHKKQESQEVEQLREEEMPEQKVAVVVPHGDEVKWQSLFLQRLDDEQAFKKVRLCIVQREETLDSIADRYCIHSREIALHNQLSELDVMEGQVLYIPIF